MPFTPFHFGPGALLKSIGRRHFSLSVFAFAQVMTDTEVLLHMANADARLHQHLHTPVGAAVIGTASWLAGRPICQAVLRWWWSTEVHQKEVFNPKPEIPLVAAAVGAYMGTFSHLFLDAIMHADVRPLSPWSDSNPFLGLVSPGMLHLLCLLAGVLGAVACSTFRKTKL